MTDLRSCPFCGSIRVGIGASYGYGSCMLIECATCGAMGPTADKPDDKEDAARLWNARDPVFLASAVLCEDAEDFMLDLIEEAREAGITEDGRTLT